MTCRTARNFRSMESVEGRKEKVVIGSNLERGEEDLLILKDMKVISISGGDGEGISFEKARKRLR